MPPLNDKQKKRLEKLSKVLDGGDIAIVQQLAEVEDRLDEVASQIPELRQAVDGVDGEKGEKGDTGAPGADGRPGTDGKDGRDGIDGKDGKNGAEGLVGPQGEPGKDGKDGANGKDGFIDVATIGYLEEEIKKLDKKHGGYGQVIRELRAGTNVTIDNSNMEYPVINATGGEGGASAWGSITGTLSAQTDLQTALNAKAASSHTHAIADVTGLQTALDGKAATLGSDDNYVTDAEKAALHTHANLAALANVSGVNTGDQVLKYEFGITVDGAGTALTTGSKGFRYIQEAGTITGWHVASDQTGSVVFDVKRSGTSLAGSEKPTLSSQSVNSDLALSTWTTSLVAGDIIEFTIDSASTVTRATLTILVTK